MTVNLAELGNADWSVAFRTYGNDHSTLIGLIVSWWIGLDKVKHEALDGGISRPTSAMGGSAKRGHCDAILLESNRAVGVLEVEGTRFEQTLIKMCDFLNDKKLGLEFGIFLAYRTTAKGRQRHRHVQPLADEIDGWVEKMKPLPAGKRIFLLGLEKIWTPDVVGIRTESGYYKCSPREVWGIELPGGHATDRVVLSSYDKS